MNLNILSKPLIDEFFSRLSLIENKSPHTLSSYRRDLNYFKDFHKQIKKNHLFQEYLHDIGLSPRSQSRVVSAVRTYFHFLENKGHEIPFQEYLEVPKGKVPLPYFITHSEFQKIFKASCSKNEIQTHRNQLVLLILFGLACRVSELTKINVEDFIDDDESIVITGKGSKQRILPVVDPLLSHLREYIYHTRYQLTSALSENSLIINNRSRRPSRVDIWRWIRQWNHIAGITKQVSPHWFRHGCATELLDEGADLRSIQVLLGHSSIETTKIYTQVTRKKLKETINTNHPFSKNDKKKAPEG